MYVCAREDWSLLFNCLKYETCMIETKPTRSANGNAVIKCLPTDEGQHLGICVWGHVSREIVLVGKGVGVGCIDCGLTLCLETMHVAGKGLPYTYVRSLQRQ